MKKILIPMFLLMMASAHATIEDDSKNVAPSSQEISKNRSCFEELSQQGCGDPGEDIQQFRSCLHNVFPTLSGDCQKMMSKLYSRK